MECFIIYEDRGQFTAVKNMIRSGFKDTFYVFHGALRGQAATVASMRINHMVDTLLNIPETMTLVKGRRRKRFKIHCPSLGIKRRAKRNDEFLSPSQVNGHQQCLCAAGALLRPWP